MSQPIDVAYVELRSRGERETARDIHNALRAIERDVDALVRDIDRSIDRILNSVEREVTSVGDVIDREAREQSGAWDGVADAIGSSIEDGANVAERALDNLADSATNHLTRITRSTDDVERSFGSMGRSAFTSLSGVSDIFSGIGRSLATIGASSPQGLTAMIAIIGAGVPAVIALGGALVDLAGIVALLPAGIGFLVAAITPLILSFQGIGGAVSALATGDLEKINEAMKNLSPSARAFAREVYALEKPLINLRKSVQEGFFREFKGELTDLVEAALPTLRRGLTDVSGSLGRFAASFTQLLGSNDILEVMGDTFETTERIIDRLTPAITDMFGVLFGAAEQGLPFLERFFNNIGNGIERFTEFLSGALQDGSFQRFLEDAFQTMGDIVDLGKSIGSLLGAIFGDAGDEGRTFIQTLTDIVDRMTEFFESAEGQQALQQMLDNIIAIAKAIEFLVEAIGFVVRSVQAFFNAIAVLIVNIGRAGVAVGEFFSSLWDGAREIGSAIGGFVGQVGEFFASIGQGLVDAYNATITFGGQVVEFFRNLPTVILEAITALPGIISDVFVTVFDSVTYAIGFGLGTIIQFFINLPSNIWNAIISLVDIVTQVFTTVTTTAVTLVSTMITSIITFFTELPGRTLAAVSFIVEVVTGVFVRVRDTAVSIVSGLVNRITSFFTDLPGRAGRAVDPLPGRILRVLRDLASRAVGVGADIINGVIRGINNGVSAAVNAAIRAANNILRGMMDALGISSPSKVFADKVGKQIPAGIEMGITTGSSTLESALNELTQSLNPGGALGGSSSSTIDSSVQFGPGAVQVIFQGVVPSEAEAARTGMAVGSGIDQRLAARDTRTAVRMM